MINFFENKKILITGGAGSIGRALVKKLLEYNPKIIRILDVNETALFNLSQEFPSDICRFLIGDIRDKGRLKRAIEEIDIVFHSAALKHILLCESNPFEAVHTNVLGTKNLIEVALDGEVEKFITVSTDKAVSPINVLGASKLLAERLTVSANLYKGSRQTCFSCVRFGNVLNSQGSVLPIFIEQIKKGGPLTVTDRGMTRFIMSINKSVELVLKVAQMCKGGEIFVLKMSSLRIEDLAKAMIEELAPLFNYNPEEIKIEFIGKRYGEKIYEELMNESETEIVSETEDMFILPPFGDSQAGSEGKIKNYKSNEGHFMTIPEIRVLLREIFNKESQFTEKVIRA